MDQNPGTLAKEGQVASSSSIPQDSSEYPDQLKQLEDSYIEKRRMLLDIGTSQSQVGVALSGGGIRSATFCLGIFQALAKRKMIRKVDFISTVSGGGYFGAFLGAMFCRDRANIDDIETRLADSDSHEVRWLRENGRYLSPNGSGGFWVLAAAMLRNWVAVQAVVLTFMALLLSLSNLIKMPFFYFAGKADYTGLFFPKPCAIIWWSPFFFLPALTFGFMVLFGFIYWFTQLDAFVMGIRKIVPWLFSLAKEGEELVSARNQLQTLFTRLLTCFLTTTAMLLILAAIDTFGQSLYANFDLCQKSLPKMWASGSAGILIVFAFAKKITALTDLLPKHRAIKIPLNLIAFAAAAIWLIALIGSVAYGVEKFSRVKDLLSSAGQQNFWQYSKWPAIGTVISALVCLIFGHILSFINLSSQQQVYAARLKRAYIGASNPNRVGKDYDVTNPLPGDDFTLEKYMPHQTGGPLHLINVTFNETVSGKSQIEERDRKGLSMCLGPAGISVGVNDHAFWVGNSRNMVDPVVAVNDTFSTLCGKITHGENPADYVKSHVVEDLPLGNWISISGAACSTGMGMNTNLGLALLLGLANVRLGYWWDSGISPGERTGRTKPNLARRLGEIFSLCFRTQSYLLDEFSARFHGPARKHWYLSDGGHFENNACYELIRRRIPFIIAIDNGRDMNSSFQDVANLTRKTRIDFNGELEFICRRSSDNLAQHRPIDPLPALDDLLDDQMLDIIGTPDNFAPVPGAPPQDSDSCSKRQGSTKHAMLARVRFGEPNQVTWILFLKPSLTGDEPLDVLQYQSTQPDFPQESTADQFFGEAQWESYRKLGEHIGSLIFAEPENTQQVSAPKWYPCNMCPPKYEANLKVSKSN